jgi:hypothetical protein
VPDDVPPFLTLQKRRNVGAEAMKDVGQMEGRGVWKLRRVYGVEEWGNVGVQA